MSVTQAVLVLALILAPALGSLFPGGQPQAERSYVLNNGDLGAKVTVAVYPPGTEGPSGGPWYPSGTQTLLLLCIQNTGAQDITGLHIDNPDGVGKAGMCVGIAPGVLPVRLDPADQILPHTFGGGWGPPIFGYEWSWGECPGCPPGYGPFKPGMWSAVFYAVNMKEDEVLREKPQVTVSSQSVSASTTMLAPVRLPRK